MMRWYRVVARWLVLAAMILVATASNSAFARLITVGANERVKTIAEAARLARDGDVVEITAGDYRSDVAIWTQKRLTIVGSGKRPVLYADGKNAEGKAIWVIRNGDFEVRNIEFRGARVPDQNGAGIRFEKGSLKVVGCAFVDNQNGILTANFADARLRIESSLFAQAPHQEGGLPHLLYVGRIASLHVSGSRFHGGYRGHLLKSRAMVSDLRYNLLVDGAGGGASYEAEFPNGGDVTLVGNVISQSTMTQNPVVVAYGAEGGVWPNNRLRMVHNTLVNDGFKPAWFLRVWDDKLKPAPEVWTRNNLLVGLGTFTTLVAGDHAGNFVAATTALGDAEILDFSLSKSSWLRGLVSPLAPAPDGLQPKYEYLVPGGLTAITPRKDWVPGAVQAYSRECGLATLLSCRT